MVKCYHIIEETTYIKSRKSLTRELATFKIKSDAVKEYNRLKKINCSTMLKIKDNELLYTKEIILVKVDLSLLGKNNVVEIIKED